MVSLQILQTLVTCIAAVASSLIDRKKYPKSFWGALTLTISLIIISGFQANVKDREIGSLNEKENIVALAYMVLSEADAVSFDKLMHLKESTPDPSIVLYIKGELSRISAQWREASSSRTSGDDFALGARLDCEKGTRPKCSSSELTTKLLNSKNWRQRYSSLIHLRSREKKTLDVLIKALTNEKNLDVRVKIKEAILRGNSGLTWMSHEEIIDNLAKDPIPSYKAFTLKDIRKDLK